LARLRKAVDVASKLMKGGDDSLLRGVTRKGASVATFGSSEFLGRVLGSYLVRNVLRVNTIQGAAAGAKVGQGIVQRLFNRFHTMIDPQQLFIYAITDPRYEKLLLLREPRTTMEFKQYAKKVRRIQGLIEGTRQVYGGEE
jgi:hypothetical protein